jgi:hypothetical protein
MRELTGHKVNPANDVLTVAALDAPGSGGAYHHYEISGFNTRTNPSTVKAHDETLNSGRAVIIFQNGPIAESGVNGVTHEALLAILIDRLECFQAGPFANVFNQGALDHLVAAQSQLQQRTKERMSRGVEGTHSL